LGAGGFGVAIPPSSDGRPAFVGISNWSAVGDYETSVKGGSLRSARIVPDSGKGPLGAAETGNRALTGTLPIFADIAAPSKRVNRLELPGTSSRAITSSE